MTIPKLMAMSDLCRAHGCTRQAVMGGVRRGELHPVKVGYTWLFDAREAEGWRPRPRGRPRGATRTQSPA